MTASKIDLPVHKVRAYLEPGPIVLVTSFWKGERNVMTMGWHSVMEFAPLLVGCVIAGSNHSFDLIRGSSACVINLPTADMIDTVVAIGNCSGRDTDKFAEFELATDGANVVDAPLLSQCHANFECRLADDALIDRYNFFIFEVVKARIARRPKHPTTLHYTGDDVFVQSGKIVSRKATSQLGLLGKRSLTSDHNCRTTDQTLQFGRLLAAQPSAAVQVIASRSLSRATVAKVEN